MKMMTALLLTASLAFADEDAQRRLDAKISLDLRDAKLSDALQPFRDATGLNFVLVNGGEANVTIQLRDLSARSALRLLLAPHGLTAVLENGAVVIRSSALGRTTLQVYDVRTLILSLVDFPAGDLVWGDMVSCFCMTPNENPNPVVADEDLLAVLIRTHTGGRSWDDNPNASLQARNGLLFVRQTPAVHREIGMLLRKLGN